MIRTIGGRRVTRLGAGYRLPCLVCDARARGRVPIKVKGKERLVDLCEPHLDELVESTEREGYISAD